MHPTLSKSTASGLDSALCSGNAWQSWQHGHAFAFGDAKIADVAGSANGKRGADTRIQGQPYTFQPRS